MNKVFISFFCCLLFLQAHGQSSGWMWAKTAEGTGGAYASRCVTDPFGNIFLSGYFPIDTMIFDQDTLFHTNRYGSDVFVVKMDANGNILWTRNYSSGRNFSNDDYDHDVTCDANGNVYVTAGLYLDSAVYDSYTLYNHDTTAINRTDAIILKLDANGNVMWARNAGGVRAETPQGICVDQNGNVYATGNFDSENFVFGNDTIRARLTSIYDQQVFLIKYDSLGNELWARQSYGDSVEVVMSMSYHVSGNIYLSGLYNSNSFQFGPLTPSLNNGFFDLFVVKCDTLGNAVWQSSAGGIDDDRSTDVVADHSGNVIVTGMFSSPTIQFGSQMIVNTVGYYDQFLVKFSSAGNIMWAQSDTSSTANTSVSVCVNPVNEIWVTGTFIGPYLLFGNDTIFNSNPGYADISVLKYDSTGVRLYSTALMGLGDDQGNQICTDVNGDLIITGYYWNNITIGPYQLTHNGSGGNQLFIARLGSMTAFGAETSLLKINAYPNPVTEELFIELPELNDRPISVLVTDILGSVISTEIAETGTKGTVRINVKNLVSGNYLVTISDGVCVNTLRFVKL